MKLRNAFLSVLALAASSTAFSQLTYVEQTPAHAWIQDIRSEPSDVALLTNGVFTVGDLNASLVSLPALTWTDETGNLGVGNSPGFNPFHVGFNGSFDVKIELGYIAKESVDNNTFSALGVNNQVLYANYGVGSVSSWTISGPATGIEYVTFSHHDAFNGVVGDHANGNVFHVFSASTDVYDYYIFAIDDRGATPGSDRDYDDGIFFVRINTGPVDIPNVPVPEPSTYGMIGAGALLALVAYRRFKGSKKSA